MAASLLFSLPLSNNRIAQACVPFLPSHQNGMRCFSMFLQKKRCNFEPYMILSKTMNRQCIFKTFASVSSINADMVFQEDVASSGSSNESAFLSRSRPLLDDPSNPSNGVNDFARQLQELFDEVKAMILMGNSSDAMDLLQANYEIVKELIDAGARGIEEAAMLDIIALGYMAIGDLGTVGSILNLLNMVIKNLKDDGPLLDSVLMHMGSMYSALGKFEKSMIAYQRVISVLESKYGRGAESKELVVPLFGLGNLLMKEGRTTDAEIHFIRILNIYRKLYGENDGRYGMALCSVANLKCSTGNVEEAIDLYRKALEVIKDSNYMAKDDTVMEKMRIDLAELLHVVGRGKEGRELLEECLLITEEYKGKEHPSSVAHLLNLATSYSQSKNFVEAERLLRISLEIMMKTVSPEDQSVTFPMLQLAMTLYNLNRDEEAEQLAVEVLRIREKAFGKDSLPVGEALDCLVSIQTRLERADTELLELLKRVLKIQEKEFGYESEEILQTLKKIVFYLAKVGRKDEKFSMQKRLSVLRTKYKQMVRY
ncbi:uncharacterized protein LOC8268186 isoform X4 [Ricinus communis]|uniref:uncharacterized protein LOC8268186 isoform X4 n=1 Tax=Ricinus communis TaxID=3988 RepID=UPI00201A471F|nr:uncharacterized protein LOC8268186 isoform X4 [Ricinus communis]